MNNFESEKVEKNTEINLDKMPTDLHMQVDLALRFYGLQKNSLTKSDLDDHMLKWVEYNDGEFATRFRKIITEHPELEAQYKANPEAALDKMEDLVYENSDVHHSH